MCKLRLQRLVGYLVAVLALVLPAFSLAVSNDFLILQHSLPSPSNYDYLGQNQFNGSVMLEYTPQHQYIYCYVKMRVAKIGNPVDKFTLNVWNGFNGVSFEDTLIASMSVDGSDITPIASASPTNTWQTFSFENCSFLPAYHTVYFQFFRTGSNDGINHYAYELRGSQVYTYTSRWVLLNTTWTHYTNPMGLDFYGDSDVSGAGIDMPASYSYNFTDQDFGVLGNMFRDVLAWLFIPTSESMARFANLWDMVKAKPPVGYFTATKEAFDGLTTASGSYYLTFSGLDSGDSPLGPIKTGLIWILWFMLGFWILHRIRQLEI